MCCSPWGHKEFGQNSAAEQQQGWSDTSLKTKGASPCSQKTTLKPQVVGVGMELGGREASVESLSVLDSSVVTLGGCV